MIPTAMRVLSVFTFRPICLATGELHTALGTLGWGTDQLAARYTFSVDGVKTEVDMTANPTSITSGDEVTVTWLNAGSYIAESKDWFGWYCGSSVASVADESFISWEYVTQDSNWKNGRGSFKTVLSPSSSSQCEFRLFNHEDGTAYYKIGTSNVLHASGGAAPQGEVSMTASPTQIKSGETVTLAWKNSGSYAPATDDWIGFYCGNDLTEVEDTGYLDWVYVTEDSNWQSGSGSISSSLYSARKPSCEFRMFNHADGSAYYKIGASDTIVVLDAGLVAQQLHLALTGDVTEMLLQYTVGSGTGVVQYTKSSLSWDSTVESAQSTCHTYKATDMCHSPATSASNFVDPGQLCEALMMGLMPDCEYKYRVTTDGGNTYTAEAVFRAAPEVDPEYSFSYVVYGDMGVGTGDQARATAKLSSKEMENGARMTHHFGDLSYARGYANIWDTWMAIIEPYAKVAPYMVSVGNHEFDYTSGSTNDPSNDTHFQPSWFNGGSDSGGECGIPTSNRFHMPSERSAGNGVFWYSYDFGSLHTVVLSAEHDLGEGSKQYKWLENDLASVDRSRTPWLVVEVHRPMYNNEMYASDYKVAENLQVLFEDLLVQYDVDLVLAGHYHSYLRSCRIYQDKCNDEKGIYHFTIGSAGGSADSVGLYNKDWDLHFEDEYGYGRITIANSSAMHWEFVRNKDDHIVPTVVDDVWILKRPEVRIV